MRRVYFPIGTCPRKEGAAEKAKEKAREKEKEARKGGEGGEGGERRRRRSGGGVEEKRKGGRSDTVETVCSGGLVSRWVALDVSAIDSEARRGSAGDPRRRRR